MNKQARASALAHALASRDPRADPRASGGVPTGSNQALFPRAVASAWMTRSCKGPLEATTPVRLLRSALL